MVNSIKAENVPWIFGTGRSGSTWLYSMMGEPSGYRAWREPLVGQLFGEFYAGTSTRPSRRDFILSNSVWKAWLEDLTPKHVEMVERITAPLLDEFYPGRTTEGSRKARRLANAPRMTPRRLTERGKPGE